MSGECDGCGEHALDCRCSHAEDKRVFMSSFLCTCGHFKECDPKTGEWRCVHCEQWLKDHYGKLRDERLKEESIKGSRK